MRYNISPLLAFTILSIVAIFIILGPFTIALAVTAGVLWIYFFVSADIVKKIELSSDVFPLRVFTDDDVVCKTILTNRSKFSLSNVEAQDLASDGYVSNGEKTISGALPSEKSVQIVYSMRFRTRGEHEFYRIKVKVESAMKLFSIERTLYSKRTILVFPKILPIDTFKTMLIEPVSGRKTDFKILEDSSHIVGVHEYSDEPFQRIHWKISAHLDNLMVKEYEYTGSSTVRMYVDYNLPKEIYARNIWALMRKDYEEYASMAASGILKYLYDHGMPITLKLLGDSVYEITPQMVRDYIPYFDVIARAKGIDEPSDDLLLQSQITKDMYSMSRTTTVVIISMYLTDEIIPKLLMIRSRVARMVIFVMPYGFRMPYEKKYDTYSVLPQEVKRLKDMSALLIENNVMVHVMMDNESVDEVMRRYEKQMGNV